jgi:hypothetical protein
MPSWALHRHVVIQGDPLLSRGFCTSREVRKEEEGRTNMDQHPRSDRNNPKWEFAILLKTIEK